MNNKNTNDEKGFVAYVFDQISIVIGITIGLYSTYIFIGYLLRTQNLDEMSTYLFGFVALVSILTTVSILLKFLGAHPFRIIFGMIVIYGSLSIPHFNNIPEKLTPEEILANKKIEETRHKTVIAEYKNKLSECEKKESEENKKVEQEEKDYLKSDEFKLCEKNKTAEFISKNKNEAKYKDGKSLLLMTAVAERCHANFSQDDFLSVLYEDNYLKSNEFKQCKKDEEAYMNKHKNDEEYKGLREGRWLRMKLGLSSGKNCYPDFKRIISMNNMTKNLEEADKIDKTFFDDANWNLNGSGRKIERKCNELRSILESISRGKYSEVE